MSAATDDARDHYATQNYYETKIRILEEDLKASYDQGAADYKQRLLEVLANYWVEGSKKAARLPEDARGTAYAYLQAIDSVVAHMHGRIDLSKAFDVSTD